MKVDGEEGNELLELVLDLVLGVAAEELEGVVPLAVGARVWQLVEEHAVQADRVGGG